MEHKYKPRGVCSYEMKIEIEENIIRKVIIEGGCAGNTIGISRLVEGMEIDEAIKRLKGIQCGSRGTSCPDQLAKALEELNKIKASK
ncbi:MAG: TIGR03905 family TSCPD domain-containing protein [Clostridia bacterium]|nr:TIGR03905 family TSCPD domain-containing protein [Clostridia bacterium]